MTQRTVEDVRAALQALGLDTSITIFNESTATAPQAAAAIGAELGSIVKSLCFLVDGQPVVILAAGDRLVDQRKVADLYGVSKKKVRIADADTTIAATGYAPGGVPPVGHITPIPVLIDESLGRFTTVYAAAGSPNAIFPIAFTRLVEITGGRVAEVAKDG